MEGTTRNERAETTLKIISFLSIVVGVCLIAASIGSDEFITYLIAGIGSIISGTLFIVVANISISLKELAEIKSEEHKTSKK